MQNINNGIPISGKTYFKATRQNHSITHFCPAPSALALVTPTSVEAHAPICHSVLGSSEGQTPNHQAVGAFWHSVKL